MLQITPAQVMTELAHHVGADNGLHVRELVTRIEQAWHDAGRSDAPRHVTSFWYALGDDAPAHLHAYARRYLGIFGDDLATAMADSCSAHSATALRDAVRRLEDAGCDELLLVPTTADAAHLDEVADLLG